MTMRRAILFQGFDQEARNDRGIVHVASVKCAGKEDGLYYDMT